MTQERVLLTREQQEEALRQAHEAAASSDPIGMVEALHQSYALDGLTRLVKRKWNAIPLDEVQFIIAGAVDVLYKDIESGKRIINLVAYLYKIADHRAHQYNDTRQREHEGNVDLEYRLTNARLPQEDVSEEELEDDELDYIEKRAQAIAIARRLIPTLGQKNIRDVMTLIIEAIEIGREDLPSDEIADTLDLVPATVRQLRHRGFKRLAQRARDEGITDRKINFARLGFDEDPRTGE